MSRGSLLLLLLLLFDEELPVPVEEEVGARETRRFLEGVDP